LFDRAIANEERLASSRAAIRDREEAEIRAYNDRQAVSASIAAEHAEATSRRRAEGEARRATLARETRQAELESVFAPRTDTPRRAEEQASIRLLDLNNRITAARERQNIANAFGARAIGAMTNAQADLIRGIEAQNTALRNSQSLYRGLHDVNRGLLVSMFEMVAGYRLVNFVINTIQKSLLAIPQAGI
ncbi:MAG: hypothetical protein P1S59_14680, partial [bacterium]|nr:hypothetical protein [bacterium]